MSNRTFLLTLGLLALTSASAFAGSGPIHQADADGDGAPVALSDQNGDGNVDHEDIGVSKDAYDCDDANPFRSPALPEKDDDGIDNDCNAKTPDAQPEDEPTRARFASNEYKGAAWDRQRFVVEHGRMTKGAAATPPTAKVNTGAGTFEVLSPDDYLFVDIYLGDTKVIGTDGHRELVPNDDAATNAINEIADRAQKKASKAKPAYRGPSKATRKAEATEAAKEVVEGEAEARLEADVEHDSRLDSIESGNDDRDEFIGQLFSTTDVLTDAQVEESEARERADTEEREARQRADREQDEALLAESDARRSTERELRAAQLAQAGSIADNSSSGVKLGFGGQGGINAHRPLIEIGDDGQPTGEYVRGTGTGGGGFELTAGVDLDNAYVGGFGALTFGSDGVGTGADTALLVGVEALGEIPGADGLHLGGFGAYRLLTAMENAVDLSVPENGGCGGVSAFYEVQTPGHVSVEPFLRVGGCYGAYGSKGTEVVDAEIVDVVSPGSGWGAVAMGGIRVTITSANKR